jgi:hypothetical protein
MTSFLPGTENAAFPVLIVIGVVIVIGLAALFLRTYFRKERTVYHDGQDVHHQAAVRPVPVHAPADRPAPAVSAVMRVPPAGTSVVEGYNTITECLDALVRKFSLEAFTIATCDGLVFASSGGGNPPGDAAKYSEIFCNDPLSETPGVVLFGLHHSGSDLVGIIRTPEEIPRRIVEIIENDTKDILNRWI